tara:strand:+ start:581 stop:856 length:276 start_codon:yes stop_codon:yes gene_type:complete
MKDKSPKKQQATVKEPAASSPKPAPKTAPKPTPASSAKVDFGANSPAALKRKILDMNDEELKSYGKQIGIAFDGDTIKFWLTATDKYNSQQ